MKYLFEGLWGDIVGAVGGVWCWHLHSWFWWTKQPEHDQRKFICSRCQRGWGWQNQPWD